MLYFLEFLFFLIFLILSTDRRLRVYETLGVFSIALIGYFSRNQLAIPFQLLVTYIGTFSCFFIYTKQRHLSFLYTTVFVYTGIFLAIQTPNIEPWDYYTRNLSFSWVSLRFVCLRFVVFLGYIYFFKTLILEETKLKEIVFLLNAIVSSITIGLFTLYFFGFFEVMHLTDPQYFYYIFYILFLAHLSIMLVLSVYNLQLINYEELNLVLEKRRKETDEILKTSRLEIINELRGLTDIGRIDLVKEYTKEYLDKQFNSVLKQEIANINDDQLELYLNEKLHSNKEVFFMIRAEEFDVDMVSNFDIYFFEIFGIILDNAIEGAKKSEDKIVELLFEGNKIVVSNSYHQDDYHYFLEKRSPKGELERVNGLKLLKHLLNKSELVVFSKVEDKITYEMMVIE